MTMLSGVWHRWPDEERISLTWRRPQEQLQSVQKECRPVGDSSTGKHFTHFSTKHCMQNATKEHTCEANPSRSTRHPHTTMKQKCHSNLFPGTQLVLTTAPLTAGRQPLPSQALAGLPAPLSPPLPSVHPPRVPTTHIPRKLALQAQTSSHEPSSFRSSRQPWATTPDRSGSLPISRSCSSRDHVAGPVASRNELAIDSKKPELRHPLGGGFPSEQ